MASKDAIKKFGKKWSRFAGPEGYREAILKIQAGFRMWREMKIFKRIKLIIKKVKIIQEMGRRYLARKSLMKKLSDERELRLKYYRGLQEKLMLDWPVLKFKKRVEIHIASLNLEVEENFLSNF